MNKQTVAERLYSTIQHYFPYEIDSDYTVDNVLSDIENSAEYVINSLLDIIENLENVL